MKNRISLMAQAGVLAAALLGVGSAARAGVPLGVSTKGQPMRWDNTRPIQYTIDPGKLGQFTNDQVARWVADALREWASVPDVTLSFEATAPYSKDITDKNVLEILNGLPEDINLIILDDDGSVLDTVFGMGDGEDTAGRAGPYIVNNETAKIVQGWAFLNGRYTYRHGPEWQQLVIQHELGHFLGLGHCQLNHHVRYDGDPNNAGLSPVMSYNRNTPNGRPGLHTDDRAWIKALYGTPAAAAKSGTIRGRVLLPDGQTGLQGIQVIARREGDEEAVAVAGMSGFRYKDGPFGGRDQALQGYYELPHLPPGHYRLSIEPLAETPVMPILHGFLPGGPRFWRASGALATRSEEATLVTVGAGQVIEGRDFVLDGPISTRVELRESEPNDVPEMAASLPMNAVVTGRVGPFDNKVWNLRLNQSYSDGIEDWYRIIVTEPTTLSATLTAENLRADVDLFLLSDTHGGLVPGADLVVASSIDNRTPPETIQIRVQPGVYFIAVSAAESIMNPEAGYQLRLLGVPSPDLPAAAKPARITFAAVGNITPTGLRVSWQTDQDVPSVLHVGFPLVELGSPVPGRRHSLDVAGLAESTLYGVHIFAGDRDARLPELVVLTPRTGTGGAPAVSAGLWSVVPQEEEDEFLLIARIANGGYGPAAGARIDRLELPAGWRFVEPPALPLDLGEIGAGASAVLAARVVRTAPDAAPLDLLIEGAYGNRDQTVRLTSR
jgi:hypothetical protein